MQIKMLKGYINGYVRIRVEGYFIEKLINLCLKKQILLWNSKRKKTTILETNVNIKDFKQFIEYVKQSKCKIKIKQKKGLPFLFNRYKKRKIFFILLFIIMISILLLSNFVWNIELVGNETISSEQLLEQLKEEGLSIGKIKSEINTKEIINKMRLNRDDLAWMGIEIMGTNAVVKIVEADKKPDIINEEEYCNIVAKKTGMIVKVNAQNGTPLVKEGDIVKENSVLIGGYLEGKYTPTTYVHANGNVKAKVWYEEKVKIEYEQVIKSRTQNQETKYSIRVNNFLINFYKTLSKFEKYDTIEEIKKVKIFSDFYLPIEIIKKTNYELKDEQVKYEKEEAKQKAVEEAKNILNGKIENKENIINTYINYTETEQYVEAQVVYEILEDIGTKEKIVF